MIVLGEPWPFACSSVMVAKGDGGGERDAIPSPTTRQQLSNLLTLLSPPSFSHSQWSVPSTSLSSSLSSARLRPSPKDRLSALAPDQTSRVPTIGGCTP